eukprot:CAMPEP_0183375408 /NCGR_PEP_ID=MMETSP0164_2-20130417/117244_1 /TAXON_ID=221442 /ORGANISM="Coccolithus pelagicus ssp braarudi, Strain PLY182g" /LENGTH=181 /DNA_ID=CAMNT_0025552573 /DNA_START=178 /DNA_END=723 /DNA_ORIENTATION=-
MPSGALNEVGLSRERQILTEAAVRHRVGAEGDERGVAVPLVLVLELLERWQRLLDLLGCACRNRPEEGDLDAEPSRLTLRFVLCLVVRGKDVPNFEVLEGIARPKLMQRAEAVCMPATPQLVGERLYPCPVFLLDPNERRLALGRRSVQAVDGVDEEQRAKSSAKAAGRIREQMAHDEAEE